MVPNLIIYYPFNYLSEHVANGIILFTLCIDFAQQEDEQGFEYIGGSIANGFYGFIGSSFRKSKFLLRAMEHFATRVNVGLIMILYILSNQKQIEKSK